LDSRARRPVEREIERMADLAIFVFWASVVAGSRSGCGRIGLASRTKSAGERGA